MEQRFGSITDDGLHNNVAGDMVAAIWLSSAERYGGIELDSFIVMPNHIHGIVHIGSDPCRVGNGSLTSLIQTFKSLTTLEYARGVRNGAYPSFDRALWQRSFYDRILRDAESLESARRYIETNPERWIEKQEMIS
jgi:REP element-mobilizing transposase RayT